MRIKESFDKWREQLLDTGKHNKLINYNDSKLRTLEVLTPDAETVFDKLMNGGTLRFYDVDEYLRRTINDCHIEGAEED